MNKKILISGSAGFIGYHTTLRLIEDGFDVLGIDNINTYYDVDLKLNRLKNLGISAFNISDDELLKSDVYPNFHFSKIELANKYAVRNIFESFKPDYVIHLAAQAGVRYSLDHPDKYIESNIVGFLNVLEAIRANPVNHLIFASSSSVYGLNNSIPFKTTDHTDHPISLYATSKKSNELMAHTYSHLFGIPSTGLRFFTVYGPWGRPDMAMFIFTKNIIEGKEINVFNEGRMSRDFTYVSDIVESLSRLIKKAPENSVTNENSNFPANTSSASYQLFNIGYNSPVKLMDFIKEIEKQSGKKAKINFKPLQAGDVENTYADVTDLYDYIDFKPQVGVEEGVKNFVDWFRSYY